MELEKIYYQFGALICHQIPDRTLHVGGKLLPVCARDTGIYIGMFIALIYLCLKGRWKCDKPPKLALTVILCIFFIPMGLDGITSYLGLRPTTNMIRIISGCFFGLAIPFFMIPIANFKVSAPNTHPSLESYKELLILGGTVLLAGLTVHNGWIHNWWFVSTIIVFTILFIYFRICYTIVVQLVNWPYIYRVLLAGLFESIIFGMLFLFRIYVFPVLV